MDAFGTCGLIGFVLTIFLILAWILTTSLWFKRFNCSAHHLDLTSIVSWNYQSSPNDETNGIYSFNPSIIQLTVDHYLVLYRKSTAAACNLWTRIKLDLIRSRYSHIGVFIMDQSFRIMHQWIAPITTSPILDSEDPRVHMHHGRVFVLFTREIKPDIKPHLIEMDLVHHRCREHSIDFSTFERPIVQKNWSAFTDDQNRFLIHTDAYPVWRVRQFHIDFSDQLTTVCEGDIRHMFPSVEYPTLRCSTTWVAFDHRYYLCGLHTKAPRLPIIRSCFTSSYLTVFVLISRSSLLPVYKTKPLCLSTNHEAIQVMTGLTVDGSDGFICGMGVSDTSCKFLKLSRSQILNAFGLSRLTVLSDRTTESMESIVQLR
jgi:hypothetical protein